MKPLEQESVITAATLSGLISAALVMLVALNVIQLDDAQMAAIVGFVALATPIAISFWPRSQVTPLSAPRDTDGVTLSRPNDVPANKELENLQSEAIELNETGEGAR